MVITKRLLWQCSRHSWRLVSEESSWSLGKRFSLQRFVVRSVCNIPVLTKKHSKTALMVHELVSFRHVFLIESCSLGHCNIQNIQASRSQFLVSLHPPWRPSKLSALTPRVMEVGKQLPTLPTIRSFTSLDHVKTEPWQWESKGRMKLPLSKTY